MEQTKEKIVIRCKKCNHRIFDYIAGDMSLEIKCNRCKTTIGVIRFMEDYVRSKAENGVYKI